MNRETKERLKEINFRFYEKFSDHFSQTRSAPWTGWSKVAQIVSHRFPSGEKLNVLDIGCGNGRFGVFLNDQLNQSIGYTGVDTSENLLKIAEDQLKPLSNVKLFKSDVSTFEFPNRRFDLIAVFGVMHHLPGYDSRRDFLKKCKHLLDHSGFLAVTFWKFLEHERYRKKLLSFDEYNRSSENPVDVCQLDPGDHLLRWGHKNEGLRYCNCPPDQEIERLVDSTGLTVVDRFFADGKSEDQNLYVVLGSEDSRETFRT